MPDEEVAPEAPAEETAPPAAPAAAVAEKRPKLSALPQRDQDRIKQGLAKLEDYQK